MAGRGRADLKLHDFTDPAEPEEAEPLDINWFVWSPKFSEGIDAVP